MDTTIVHTLTSSVDWTNRVATSTCMLVCMSVYSVTTYMKTHCTQIRNNVSHG